MSPLHPSQLTLMRVRAAIVALMVLIPLAAADYFLVENDDLKFGIVTGAGAAALLLAVWLLPRRRFARWGYRMAEDELAVRHGVMVHHLTVVPFGRVQHIDVAQGPLERGFGLATLILNTAGTRGASVRLPGLLHGEAEAMRDHIRGKIRQDLA